jgi:ABC-type sugar transport system ATPase subunit
MGSQAASQGKRPAWHRCLLTQEMSGQDKDHSDTDHSDTDKSSTSLSLGQQQICHILRNKAKKFQIIVMDPMNIRKYVVEK